MANIPTPPAEKTYIVWADRRCFQHVQASSPEAAFAEAQRYPGDFEPCSDGIENFALHPVVADRDTDSEFRVGPSARSHDPLSRIDGPALRAQSEWLLAFAGTDHYATLNQRGKAAVDGLIHLLDAIRDTCHDAHGIDCLLIDPETKDRGDSCPVCGNTRCLG